MDQRNVRVIKNDSMKKGEELPSPPNLEKGHLQGDNNTH